MTQSTPPTPHPTRAPGPVTAAARDSGAAASTRRQLPGLDGLRGLAVLAVVLFHLDPRWLPGGFLGVDMFFVLSGFLITTLLVREHRWTGAIDLRTFWVRRARRLLPALLVMVPIATVASAVVERDLLVGIGRQTLGALTFSTNWIEIAAGSDYFHGTSPQLLMNLWSLAVEEQFYLVWPVVALVLLTRTRSWRVRIGVAVATGALSALLMATLLDPAAPTRVYYGTDTHLIGLMLGVALALAWAAPHRAWSRSPTWQRARPWLVPAAGGILAVLLITLDESRPVTFRGGIVLASLTTAVLVLAVISAPGPLRQLLRVPALVWLGVRSYGIYLWHWPVILILDQLWPTTSGSLTYVLSRILAVIVTLAAAHVSFRYVEAPMRRDGLRATARAGYARVVALPQRARRATFAALVVTLTVWAVVVVTAPDTTSTQRLLVANADAATAVASEPSVVGEVAALTEQQRQAGFTMPIGDEIDVFGDSLVVGSVPALQYWLPGIRIDAESNRHWSDGLAQVQGRGSDVRRAVVLAFGTNAGFDAAAVDDLIGLLGPDRMIVLVNEYGRFSRIDADNAALAEVAAAHPNVIVADWHGAVSGTSGELQPDGIHPSLTGQHLYTTTIRAALAELSERHTGVPVTLEEKPIP